MTAVAAKMNREALVEHRRRILTDTGYCARHLCGYNYDIDHRTGQRINVGEGGVRATGPQQEQVEFLDASTSGQIQILAPRGTYKSCRLTAYVVRRILANPNIGILYGMHCEPKALEKVRAVHRVLRSPKCQELFGPFDLTGGERSLSTSLRTDDGRAEPTLSVFSPEKSQTGGHYELIICDDLVDSKNSRTSEGIEKVNRLGRSLSPMLLPGGLFINQGTLYAHGDWHDECLNNPQFARRLIHDSGTVRVEEIDGRRTVVGEPRYPHETLEYLQRELDNMLYEHFMSQYMNRIVSGIHQEFRPEYFKTCNATEQLLDVLTGYVLTDTATSTKREACHSVIAYVGIDQQRTAYVLDVAVGHWTPAMFISHFFEMRDRWRNRVHHAAELMERTSANQVYRSQLEDMARARNERLNLIELPRVGSESGTPERIRRLQPRCAAGRLWICNTVPRCYSDGTRTETLYDPEVIDETGVPRPAGELVKQFTQFRKYGRDDIADCLADIDVQDERGAYICAWKPDASRAPAHLRKQSPYETGIRMPIGSFPQFDTPELRDQAWRNADLGETWQEQFARRIG